MIGSLRNDRFSPVSLACLSGGDVPGQCPSLDVSTPTPAAWAQQVSACWPPELAVRRKQSDSNSNFIDTCYPPLVLADHIFVLVHLQAQNPLSLEQRLIAGEIILTPHHSDSGAGL